MGGGFVFFTIVALAIIAITTIRRSSAQAAWNGVAVKLGLHYQQKGTFGERRLSGKIDGFRVSVKTERVRRGQSRKIFTCYVVHYPSLGLGLELGRESSVTALGKYLGKQDLETGDRQFDREVRITAKSREKLIAFLTPLRKTVILRTLSRYGRCMIFDARVECRQRGLALNARDMKLTLRNLVDLAQALTGTMIEEEVQEVLLPPIPLPEEGEESAENLEPVSYAELFPLVEEEEPATEVEDDRELEPAPEPVPEPAVEARPKPVSEPAPPEISPALPAIAAILEELFPENQPANVTAEVFEQRYRDTRVRGSGRLQRVEHYFSDRFFGSKPGARATLVIRESSTAAFGVREVQAVLQLDAEEEAWLQDRIGETVAFQGRMVHCDPYLRSLVVAEATAR